MGKQKIKNSLVDILDGKVEINFVPSFRNQLRKSGLLGEYKCKCGCNGEWMGKNITLELEHKNGNRNNNTRENLEWLCPNCHSQTSTYRKNNKNKPRKNLVNDDKLKDSIKQGGSVTEILERVGLKVTGDNYNRVYKLE